MLRKGLLWLAGSVLLVFVSIYTFRNALTLRLAAPYLVESGVTVSCLDWSASGIGQITLHKVCLEHEAALIEINDATVSKQQIDITSLKVSLLKQQNDNNSAKPLEPLNIPLPLVRPLVNVQYARIQGNQLKAPITFNLVEDKLNQFSVKGDVRTRVALSANNVELQNFDLSSPLFSPYFPQQIKSVAGFANAQFNGVNTELSLSVDTRVSEVLNQCGVDTHLIGGIAASADLNKLNALVDLSKLNILIDTNNCQQTLQSVMPKGLVAAGLQEAQWQLKTNDIWHITPSSISTKRLSLVNGETNQIAFYNLEVSPQSLSLQGSVRIEHSSSILGNVSVKGPINVGNQAVEAQLNILAQVPNLPEFVTAQSPIKQANTELNSRLNISGALSDTVSFEAHSTITLLNTKTDYASVDKLTFSPSIVGKAKVAKKELLDLVVSAQLVAESIAAEQIELPHLNMAFYASGSIGERPKLHMSGEVKLPDIKHTQAQAKGFNLNWQGQIEEQILDLEIDWLLAGVKQGDNQVQGVQQSIKVASSSEDVIAHLTFSAQTHLDALANKELMVEDINISSTGKWQSTPHFEHDINALGADISFRHGLQEDAMPFELVMIEQDLVGFQPLLEQLTPKLKIEEGSSSLVASGDLLTQKVDFDIQFNSSVLYDTHYIRDISSQVSGSLDSGLINVLPTMVNIREIRSGAILTDISAQLEMQNSNGWLSNLKATGFDGQLTAPIVYLNDQEQVIAAKAHNLDLEILAQAGRDAGVALSGRVSGDLPVLVKGGKISITNGQLYSLGAGNLSVSENESVSALKAQQPSLKTVIGLLDDLDINSLYSDVSLTEDGWLTLAVNIVGENKEQAQPVNFNYSHYENIYTLFRALRLNDEISQQVEKALN